MHVEISADNMINGSEAPIAGLTTAICHAVAHFEAHVTRVEAHLQDTDADQSGPDDIECTLAVRRKGQQPVISKNASISVEKPRKAPGPR